MINYSYNQNSYNQSIEKGTLLTFGAKSIYFLLAFVIGIIIARTIGPEGKGIYSLVTLTCSLVAILVGLGIPTSNACFVGRKPNKVSSIVGNSLLLMIVLVLALGIVFTVLSRMIESNKLKYIGIAFTVAPFLLLINLFVEILRGMNKISEYNLVLVAVPFFQLIILLFLLNALTLKLALISWALSYVIGGGLTTLILLRIKNGAYSLQIDLPLLKESIIFGIQIWLAQIIGMLNLRFDIYLVAYYLGAKEVGYYSVAMTVAGFLFYIPSSIATVVLPRFTSCDAKIASKIACQALRVSLFFGALLLLLLLGIGKFIVPLFYGDAFMGAIIPLFILLPGVAVYGMAHITSAYFNGYIGRPVINTGLAGLSLAIDIGLNIILIPRLGVNGAAISCTISYIISIIVCIYIFTKLSGSSIKDVIGIKMGDVQSYLRILKWNSQ